MTNEQRETLIADYLEKKMTTDRYAKDMVRAIAYAKRLVEDGELVEAEVYCHFLTKDEVMVPSDFWDFLWTLTRDEIENLAMSAQQDMQNVLKGAKRMTKQEKAAKIREMSNKISDAAIKGESQAVLVQLIRESMALIDTPTED